VPDPASYTKRPVTVDMGTNILVGRDPRLLDSELTRILEGGAKKGSIPPLGDGRASERIVRALREYLAP
jgi:UDP-N-acetylglucosamine 2-epimerase (non-hydrolysing)